MAIKNTTNTILFVEDNPLVLTIYRNRLEAEGYSVEAAEDGLIALEKLPMLRPCLVILDLMLPKLDGMDVLTFIRGDDELKETPVLVLSNAYLDERSSKAMAAGANKRLQKTQCTPAKMIEAVRELTGSKAARPSREGADEASLKESRSDLMKEGPAEVSKIRELCLGFVKAADDAQRGEVLNKLYQRVRFLCVRAGLGECSRVGHLASALEAILFEIILKKNISSPSMFQSIAQAVDCLGRLFQAQDVEMAQETLHAKVLVVDDDPICNFATVAAMKRAKMEAVSTQDPLTALKMAQTETYDVILLDITMPRISGFELCEKIRQLPGYKKTPVIFVTSNGEFQNRAQAVLSGGNDLIAKPIAPLELALKTVMRLLDPSDHPDRAVGAKKRVASVSETVAPPIPAAPAKPQRSPALAGDASAGGRDKKAGWESLARTVGASSAPAAPPSPATPLMSEARATASPKPADPAPARPPASPPPPASAPPPAVNGAPSSQETGKDQQELLEKLVPEVTRIIFGDQPHSEIQRRLTRIALERYNIPQIINRTAAAEGEGKKGLNGAPDPLDQVARHITRIIFGDEGVSDINVRLTRIALERYHVAEMLGQSSDSDRDNLSPGVIVNL
ncbi:MAG: response regulator [Verrucomicrobia bacterium]|nr:response regulator [Verrucomicrobiota bacterium]MDE3099340.1 response regulator [Verrucomicrobiota bacterium]